MDSSAIARRKLAKSYSVQEAGFTFKKVEGDLDDALLVGLVDGKQEFLFSFFITLGFPHFVNSYFKVHFCTSREQQGCYLLFYQTWLWYLQVHFGVLGSDEKK